MRPPASLPHTTPLSLPRSYFLFADYFSTTKTEQAIPPKTTAHFACNMYQHTQKPQQQTYRSKVTCVQQYLSYVCLGNYSSNVAQFNTNLHKTKTHLYLEK
jgi:hypothetical protein